MTARGLAIGFPVFWKRPARATSVEREAPAENTGPPLGGDDEENASCRGCVVYSAGSLHEAQLVLDLLGEAGIVARLFNTHLVGAMGELPFYQSLPRIWLADEEDLGRAREVIETYEARRRQTTDETRHCGACGEESPGNFEVCWSCREPFEEDG